MATLSSLVVDIRTNTAKFTQGMNKAQRRLQKFSRGVKKTSRALGSLFKRVAVGGLIGGGIFALIIKQSLNAIDNIGKLSKTYGIATQDLAAFQLAAELGGSSLETFAKASRNVSVAVFDFLVRGTGLAVDAFRQLGITQKDLIPIQNDNAALMGLIGDRLNEMEDGAVKTATATKLLGGRAVELLPALAGGSAQMRKFKEEAILFGTALDASAVKGVEDANDSITRLGFVFKGARDQITAALAPALELLVTRIRETIIEAAKSQGGIEKFAQNIARSIINLFIKAIEGVQALSSAVKTTLSDFGVSAGGSIDDLDRKLAKNTKNIEAAQRQSRKFVEEINSIEGRIKTGDVGLLEGLFLPLKRANFKSSEELIDRLIEKQSKLAKQIEMAGGFADTGDSGIVAFLNDLKNQIGKNTDANDEFTSSLKGSGDAINNNADAIKKQIETLAFNAENISKTADEITLLKLGLDGATPAQLKLAESSLMAIAAFEKEQEQIAATKSIVDSIQTPLQDFETKIIALNDALAFGTLTYDQYDVAIKKYQDELEKASKKTDELGEFAKQAARNIQDSLGDTLFNILDGNFDNIGQSFDKLIKRMIANAAAAQIGEMLFPNLNGTGGGTGNSFFDGILGSLFGGARADGGPVSSGSAYLVGERGPEIFMPSSGGNIIPNGAGGMSVINNFYISGETDRRSQQQIADAAYRGTVRANARNG